MLKLIQTPDIKVYFTSDFHLGHNKPFVVEKRGYKNVKEHDDAIVDTTNSIVGRNDILLFLGDYCLNTNYDAFNDYLSRFKCDNIWTLWGNHNNPHEKLIYRKSLTSPTVEMYPIQYRNMRYLGHYQEVSVDGQMIVLFHYPISVWNEMHHGSWHLCGHSHYDYAPSRAGSLEGKILDVGWDGFKKPLSFDEVSKIMKNKKTISVDHH